MNSFAIADISVTDKPTLGTGYLAPEYATALAEFGVPTQLPRAGGWFLKRPIAGFPYVDGMGCYPMLSCRDWTRLDADLDAAGRELVCFSAVIDPFGNHDEALLKRCFPDVAFHFKNHYVTDLSQPPESYISPRHLRNVKKATQAVGVERCENPSVFLADWMRLYGVLIERHSIRGLSAFSSESFARQLQVPGLVMFRATLNGETVGMLLWLVQNGVAYYHLGAYTDAGYELRASFALFWNVIEHFTAQKLKWLNLGAGAGAGLTDAATDGLSVFKSGWSNGTRPAWFCGRVFNRVSYDSMVAARNIAPTKYFPAYRQGEFA